MGGRTHPDQYAPDPPPPATPGAGHVGHVRPATREPMVAIAQVKDGIIEAWAPTQSPWDARKSVAEYLKVGTDKVAVHVTLLGGAFGRKSKPDYICEAAFLAREAGVPVRVQWTRQDDLQHSYYHSVAAHRLEAAMEPSGKVTAWRHRSAYPPISATFAPGVNGPDPDDLTNGASDLPFAIQKRVEMARALAADPLLLVAVVGEGAAGLAARAASALSPWANTATRTLLPVPAGSTTEPRTS